MKNQTTQRESKRRAAKKKLTNSELKALQEKHNMLVKLNQERNSVCCDKELKIRAINKDFDKKFDHLTVSIENQTGIYKKHINELNAKYGLNAGFDLKTGAITYPEPPKPAKSPESQQETPKDGDNKE